MTGTNTATFWYSVGYKEKQSFLHWHQFYVFSMAEPHSWEWNIFQGISCLNISEKSFVHIKLNNAYCSVTDRGRRECEGTCGSLFHSNLDRFAERSNKIMVKYQANLELESRHNSRRWKFPSFGCSTWDIIEKNVSKREKEIWNGSRLRFRYFSVESVWLLSTSAAFLGITQQSKMERNGREKQKERENCYF